MRKIHHLSTCHTCQRIVKELPPEEKEFEFRNIKRDNISADQLDGVKGMVGSYAALFSRRAMKFRSMGLKEMTLSGADHRRYILQEYTFLKRPVIRVDGAVFVGNTWKTIAAIAEKRG